MEINIDNVVEVRWLTDDCDERDRTELVIYQGGNGDWYVGVAREGCGALGTTVRCRTSGGASSRVPGMNAGIASIFRALIAAGPGNGVTIKMRSGEEFK
jgi:hypothetical protein